MAYYLGLDAGGTKTECALARDNTVLARATAGTIKVMRASTEEAERNLNALLQSVSTHAGVALDSIACTCVGLAGISVPRIADWVRQSLHARVSGEVLLSGDEVIALDAAFRGGAGVLVMAGTGSNIIARSSAGTLVHVGGWGPAVADEGSGNWIGKQAVRAIFDAMDRNETTLLLPAVLSAWTLPDLGSLIDRANQSPGPDFSRLTPVVVRCAEQEDPYAERILQQAGKDLGTYAMLALQRAQMLGPARAALPEIAYTGSVLRHIAPVRESMFAAVRQKVPGVILQAEAVDPVEGALWRARQHCSLATSVNGKALTP